MTKALTRRRSLPAIRGFANQDLMLLVLLATVVLFFLLKSKPVSSIGQYTNKEEWSVSYNSDGLPTKIVIHRDAKRQ